MYRHGGITPTLIVCGTKKTISFLMPESENRNARAEQLIRLATQLAHSRTVGEIDLVVLVTQAWASPAREPFTIQPSKDPNRCEVLVISALDGRDQRAKTASLCLHTRAKRGPNRPQTLAGTGTCQSGRPAAASVPDRIPPGEE